MSRFSAHLGFLYQEVPLLERPMLAAKDGFAAVDITEPTQVPLRQLGISVRDANVQVIQVSTSMGRQEVGEMGLTSLPDRCSDFREDCERLLEYAVTLGCEWVHPIAGVPAQHFAPEAVRSTYLKNLAFAADLFAGHGIGTVIEPCNTALNPGFHLRTLPQALAVIDELRDHGIKLLYDTFHMAMTGVDPAWGVRRHGTEIGMVQVGDSPERHEPGTSTIDFPAFFAALAESGYAGWVSCEYIPATVTTAGLGWMSDYK